MSSLLSIRHEMTNTLKHSLCRHCTAELHQRCPGDLQTCQAVAGHVSLNCTLKQLNMHTILPLLVANPVGLYTHCGTTEYRTVDLHQAVPVGIVADTGPQENTDCLEARSGGGCPA